MPSFSRTFGSPSGTARINLVVSGPLIRVSIGLPDPWVEALRSRGFVPPPAVVGEALIDTGASLCAIDRIVVERLGLPSRGTERIATFGGFEEEMTHPAQIEFLDGTLSSRVRDDIVGMDLRPLGVIAIIGRNVLADWNINYDGPTGTITITG